MSTCLASAAERRCWLRVPPSNQIKDLAQLGKQVAHMSQECHGCDGYRVPCPRASTQFALRACGGNPEYTTLILPPFASDRLEVSYSSRTANMYVCLFSIVVSACQFTPVGRQRTLWAGIGVTRFPREDNPLLHKIGVTISKSAYGSPCVPI